MRTKYYGAYSTCPRRHSKYAVRSSLHSDLSCSDLRQEWKSDSRKHPDSLMHSIKSLRISWHDEDMCWCRCGSIKMRFYLQIDRQSQNNVTLGGSYSRWLYIYDLFFECQHAHHQARHRHVRTQSLADPRCLPERAHQSAHKRTSLKWSMWYSIEAHIYIYRERADKTSLTSEVHCALIELARNSNNRRVI